jgi:CheY-like chemotaxis protein
MQGGNVIAASAGPGRGATFRVSFPALIGERQPAVAPQTGSVPHLGQIRILVVDDERDARDLIAAALSQAGADVLTVASVALALPLLDAPPDRRPQVLIADIGMPDESGYDLVARVRSADPPGSRMPVLAVTAYARDEDRRRALEAGFDVHLSKPVTPEALVAAVHRFFAAEPEPGPQIINDPVG